MKFSIGICIILIAAVSCLAEDSPVTGKKTEKRGIYGGFGYGHYGPSVVSHGYHIGHHGGYYGGHGDYYGGLGHGSYHGGFLGGYHPGYHGFGHGFGGLHHY